MNVITPLVGWGWTAYGIISVKQMIEKYESGIINIVRLLTGREITIDLAESSIAWRYYGLQLDLKGDIRVLARLAEAAVDGDRVGLAERFEELKERMQVYGTFRFEDNDQ